MILNFTFGGSISREVLNNCLSHAVTHTGLGMDCYSPGLDTEFVLQACVFKYIKKSVVLVKSYHLLPYPQTGP